MDKKSSTDNNSDQPIFGKKAKVAKKTSKSVASGSSANSTPIFASGNNSSNSAQPTPVANGAPVVAKGKPMNPKTKKKIIIGVVLGLVAIVAVVVAIVVILIMTHVDYKTAYEQAEELEEAFSDLQYDSACGTVKNSVDSTYYTAKEYGKYIEKCRNSGGEVGTMVAELGETDAVKKDSEIGEKYDKFKKAFDKTYLAGNANDKLDLYEAWHNFALAVYDLGYFGDNNDAKLEKTANFLIDSGDDTLKAYGERWLELRKTAEKAYKAYYDADWSGDTSALYKAYDEAYDAYYDFYRDEEIDWDEVAEMDTDLSDADSKFTKLFRAIRDKYEESE